jgi:hypothetical protein
MIAPAGTQTLFPVDATAVTVDAPVQHQAALDPIFETVINLPCAGSNTVEFEFVTVSGTVGELMDARL